MSALPAVHPSPDAWGAFVAGHPQAHILQTGEWGSLKSAFGWSAERVALLDSDGAIRAGAQLLYRPLPLRLGTWAYVPKGPLAPAEWWYDPEKMHGLWAAIHDAARRQGARWLTVEAPGEESDITAAALRAGGFRPAPHNVQPVRTILVDLNGDEDTVLSAMKQKTRYNIRLSARKGVVVRQGTRADVDSFNAMLRITGSRDAFGVHVPTYYEKAYDLFAPPDRAALFIAAHDGHDLAGIMVFVLGRTAWYFYGASTDDDRQRMPTYAVQWAAIQWAQARGCAVYDLWGVPDEDETTLEAQFNQHNDGLWGVYRFKRGFGGRLVRQMPAWNRVYSPPVYALYQLYLKVSRSAKRAD